MIYKQPMGDAQIIILFFCTLSLLRMYCKLRRTPKHVLRCGMNKICNCVTLNYYKLLITKLYYYVLIIINYQINYY